MNGPDHSQFWKAGLRRNLTSEEEAQWQDRLNAQPDALARFEDEVNLNRLLQHLPEPPVSSNFTAQVIQRIQRESRPHARPFVLRWWADYIALGWGRKLAFASVLLLLSLLSYQQYQLSARRELARSVSRMSSFVLPAPDVIEDFKAIEGLQQVSSRKTEEPDLLDALP